MRVSAVTGLAVALAMIAAPAPAQNLVLNPDFTSDIAQWSAIGTAGASGAWLGALGSPTPGSAELTASGTGFFDLYQCVTMSAPGNYDFLVHMRTQSSVGDASSRAAVWFWTGATCNGTSVGSNVATNESPLGGGWVERSVVNAPLPAGTMSVFVQLDVQSNVAGAAIDVLFDNVRFGPAGTVPVRLQRLTVE